MIGQRAANERRANAQIAPGLSIPDRRGELGQCEQSFHLVFGDRTRQKVAYVPAPYQQSLQHVGRRCRPVIWPGFFHHNSIPAWSFTPPQKGCFPKAISVNTSAIPTSAGGAFLPVTHNWTRAGLALRVATPSA